jgi:predicted transcriptional regulator
MDEKELYSILGYVTISKYRTNILKSIGKDFKIPSQIGKELGIGTSQVSSGLSDLKDKGLVVCLNEEVRKGRLYKCTPTGLKILELLK